MKARRHDAIKDLIRHNDIETQEELLNRLRGTGYDVTQATVSRDIKELRLVKALSPSGKYRYSTGQEISKDISSKFVSLFSDSVTNIESAQNLVVIKCLNGMAQAICAAMDANNAHGFIGTIAGEDTILCICKNNEIAFDKQEELKKYIAN